MLVEKRIAKDRWRGHIRTREIRDYWRFEVVPGAINYPGQMVIYTNGGLRQGISDVRLVNRSGHIWLILRKRYPELVARYPVVHTGGVRDAFFERLTRREPPVRESDE